MPIAELTAPSRACRLAAFGRGLAPRPGRAKGSATKAVVRLEIHDTSRVEWNVSIPTGAGGEAAQVHHRRRARTANAFARNTPWDSCSPSRASMAEGDDVLVGSGEHRHRFAEPVALAEQLSRASEGFARALSVLRVALRDDAARIFESRSSSGSTSRAHWPEARTRLVDRQPEGGAELLRERESSMST